MKRHVVQLEKNDQNSMVKLAKVVQQIQHRWITEIPWKDSKKRWLGKFSEFCGGFIKDYLVFMIEWTIDPTYMKLCNTTTHNWSLVQLLSFMSEPYIQDAYTKDLELIQKGDATLRPRHVVFPILEGRHLILTTNHNLWNNTCHY